MITKADRGGAVVIWDTTDCMKEAYLQLNDEKTFRKLDKDPTIQHKNTVSETISTLKREK